MRRLGVALVVLLGLGASGVATGYAHAGAVCSIGWSCGLIGHASPDRGVDTPFLISCQWSSSKGPVPGFSHEVAAGESSNKYCEDMDGIYVEPGRRIVCFLGPGLDTVVLDTPGWQKLTDNWRYHECVYQAA